MNINTSLTEKDKTLMGLIDKLAEIANDETTTQTAIDGILGKIKEASAGESVYPPSSAQNTTSDGRRLVGNVYVNPVLGGETYSSNREEFIFTRIREVKSPCKAHPTDAGIDFFVPDEKAWNSEFKDKVVEFSRNPDSGSDSPLWFYEDDNGTPNLRVMPNVHVAIPSGIKTIIPRNYGMMFVNKSGIATKMKLDHSACLVDSEYRDEIIMCFFNHSTEPVVLTPGMKITQGLIVPIINMPLTEVLNRVYDDMGSSENRGGGFGSSGI